MNDNREYTCENCAFCRFWNPWLECHKNPPTTDGFIHVRRHDWCGEFKMKPLPTTRAACDGLAYLHPSIDGEF